MHLCLDGCSHHFRNAFPSTNVITNMSDFVKFERYLNTFLLIYFFKSLRSLKV